MSVGVLAVSPLFQLGWSNGVSCRDQVTEPGHWGSECGGQGARPRRSRQRGPPHTHTAFLTQDLQFDLTGVLPANASERSKLGMAWNPRRQQSRGTPEGQDPVSGEEGTSEAILRTLGFGVTETLCLASLACSSGKVLSGRGPGPRGAGLSDLALPSGLRGARASERRCPCV